MDLRPKPVRLVALGLVLAGCAPAHAAIVASVQGNLVAGPVPAGDATVWLESPSPEVLRVVRVGTAGPREVVAEIPAAFTAGPGETLWRSARLAASEEGFIVSESTRTVVEDEPGIFRAIREESRVFRGPTLVAACPGSSAVDVAASGSAVAYQDPCDSSKLIVVAGQSEEVIQAAWEFGWGFDALRLSGRYVSWTVQLSDGAALPTVYDLATQREVYEVRDSKGLNVTSWSGVGLQEDGTLVLAANTSRGWIVGPRAFGVFSPQVPRGRLVHPRPLDRQIAAIRVASGRVAYLAHSEPLNRLHGSADRELVVGDLSGRWSTVQRFGSGAAIVGYDYPTLAGPDFEPFGFDGKRLTWAVDRCGEVTIESAAASSSHSAVAERFRVCDEPTILAQKLRVEGSTLPIVVTCPTSCRGRLEVTGGRPIRFSSRGARTIAVRARLSHFMLKRLAQDRTVRVFVSLHRGSDRLYLGTARLARGRRG